MLNELSFLNDTVIRDTKEYAGKKLAAKAYELTESVEKTEKELRDSLEKTINKNTGKIRNEAEKEIALREKEAFKKLVLCKDSIKEDIKKELQKRLCDFAKPHSSLGWAEAVWRSPVGEIRSAWRYEEHKLTLDFSVPVPAMIELPNGETHEIEAGEAHYEILL